jgi:acetolactate synthase-1/3 small subunit
VLVRVSLVFARRGYNIESLVVSPDAANGDFSRMTITCRGDSRRLRADLQAADQADRRGPRHRPHRSVGGGDRDRALKIKAADHSPHRGPADRRALQGQGGRLRSESLVLRVYGESEKLDSFVALLRPFGIVELVRSGKVLMARGPATT